jgi:hypothetical protein
VRLEQPPSLKNKRFVTAEKDAGEDLEKSGLGEDLDLRLGNDELYV